MVDIAQWFIETRGTIEDWIREDLPLHKSDQPMVEDVMRYSLLAGGKRLRPQLVLATADYVGLSYNKVRAAALAVEYLHTYSLIHDDLPAMDNDDLRRGMPTAHKVYGDAMAILAGDALLTESWVKMMNLVTEGFDVQDVLAASRALAVAAGRSGLVRGQVLDLSAENRVLSREQLEAIHRLKTGALFEACCIIPAILIGDSKAQAELAEFARHFGLAFQIVDDILNVIGDRAVMGKATGTDVALGKSTYPGLLGIDEAQRLAKGYQKRAEQVLDDRKTTDVLLAILRFAVDRQW